MTKQEIQNRARFNAYISAAQYLQEIVGARSNETDNKNEKLTNAEYLRIAKQFEATAKRYRKKFP